MKTDLTASGKRATSGIRGWIIMTSQRIIGLTTPIGEIPEATSSERIVLESDSQILDPID